jgi:MFS superfamily sulfate permease-like transporter
MAFCSHGAGGLAGQYRFGSRSEMSVIILGSCKLLLGILFGSSLVGLLDLFPKSILAVMLFVSAIEVIETKDKLPLPNFSVLNIAGFCGEGGRSWRNRREEED